MDIIFQLYRCKHGARPIPNINFHTNIKGGTAIGIHLSAACLAGHSCVDHITSWRMTSTQSTPEGVAAVDIDYTSFTQRALQDTAAWTNGPNRRNGPTITQYY